MACESAARQRPNGTCRSCPNTEGNLRVSGAERREPENAFNHGRSTVKGCPIFSVLHPDALIPMRIRNAMNTVVLCVATLRPRSTSAESRKFDKDSCGSNSWSGMPRACSPLYSTPHGWRVETCVSNTRTSTTWRS